ncbi:ankyrin repeat domain-containing protein [Pseudanabaena sp. UWO310]|uniref:ankyrin repeat domain-containing protein n=1 Tax=Pseudanabaena sp. UWO310 TaxID=2480795 RepID=UPI0011613EBB|nr:ankyrin repeat domain-containing protein [Pseudanabaena sp. UWO310]TYQ23950.1 hypothetical protein PseudUWO310_21550 [Pseudanabaena sp. UWO310]
MTKTKSIKVKNLVEAIRSKNLELVEQLIAEGVKINSNDCHGRTPLSYAVQYQVIPIIQVLLDSGADANLGDEDTNIISAISPLMRIVNTSVKDNRPQKIREIIQVLLQGGVNINQRYAGGRTALMKAVSNRDHEMIEILIEIGVDLEVKDNDGNSALMIARYEGGAKSVNILKQSGASTEGLAEIEMIHAVMKKDLDKLKRLLRENPNLNGNHRVSEVTPLCIAVQNGDYEATKLLIESGSDVNLRGSEGSLTPLIYAVLAGHTDILRLLLNTGADVHARVEGFKNALEYAELDKIAKVDRPFDEIINLLKSHGAVKNLSKSKR